MRLCWAKIVVSLMVWASATAARASDAPSPPAPSKAFALIIGVNASPDPKLLPLRYADDDAVRFRDLFRTVGAQTILLTSLDDNTRRLHPDADAEALPARLDTLTSAVTRLGDEVAAARAEGFKIVFYFVYAGHGRVEGNGGSISLEEGQLRGAEILSRIIDKVVADESHVIVDACNSYFLVLGRGPGGSRRPIGRFAQLGALADRQDVGLLLSTSSARESHEWAAFQSGVFSHEVRSGLYGAADVNRDGLVSYVELGAFIDRANAAISNERFRPEVFGRPPTGSEVFMDLRPALSQRIEVDPGDGHQFIEDTSGIRFADFHNSAPVHLLRPSAGRLYLRRMADDRERVLPPQVGVVRTAKLPLQEPRTGVRNAANDAFASLFAIPFSTDAVSTYRSRTELLVESQRAPFKKASFWERPRTFVGLGLGALGLGSMTWGMLDLLDARSTRNSVGSSMPQQSVQDLNKRIAKQNTRGGVLLGVGAAAVIGGLFSVLWPESSIELRVEPETLNGRIGGELRGTF